MLALTFRAGDTPLAIDTRLVVEVLPRVALQKAPLAPEAVIGLLPFRHTLTPVVDLCWLVVGRSARAQLGTRIIVTRVERQDRFVGLLAEDVSELIDSRSLVVGLNHVDQPWLGEHLADDASMPLIVHPGELLPDALQRLFSTDAQ
jgi:chemotaxis-related protein WspB